MNFEKILKYTIIGGLFLIPLIPFIVTNSMFFPFITGKNFIFRFLVEVIFGLWILLALKNRIYRPSFSWIGIAVFLFIFIIAIADLFGENPFKSFWSNFERMEGFVGLLHLGAYFLVAGTVLNTRRLWFNLANVSVLASVIMGIYGLVQIAGKLVINQGGVRVDGTFGNAAYLAVYMIFHVFITALLLIKWRGASFVRYFYIGAIFLQIYILFETATRGAILGLVGGLLLTSLLIVIFGREYKQLRKVSFVFIMVVLLAVTSLFIARNTSFVKDGLVLSRLASISLSEGSSRFTIWSMAFEGFKERPVLGWGQENFNYVFNKYYDPSLYKDEPWFDRAHNIFFDWLIAGGALGLLTYLSIFLATLYYLWRKESRVHFSILESSLLTGLLAAYFIHNIFVFDNVVSYILFFSVLAYVYNETRAGEGNGLCSSFRISKGVLHRLVTPLVIVSMFGGVYLLNGTGLAKATRVIDALSASDLSNRTEIFRELTSGARGLGSQEITEQLVQTAIAVVRSNASIEQKQEVFSLSEKELKRQIRYAPNDARLHVFLGSLYDQFSQQEKARDEIKQALKLSPNKQRIHYQLAFNYLNSGKYEESLKAFKKTYELDPDSDESRIYYASLALYSGQDELANEILKPIISHRLDTLGVSVIDDEVLLGAYVKTGRFDKVLEIWEYRAKNNPKNAKILLSLSATLIQLGRNEEAIAEIRKVINLEPGFEKQGKQFIEEIRAGRGKSLIQ